MKEGDTLTLEDLEIETPDGREHAVFIFLNLSYLMQHNLF